ncbi:hypothetical protein [Empedobacter stercoris]|uniref:hypothetical protein n=1 Tax=Empedobacter stercoris TaxID=1628248 RepID=UPI001CE0342B|nr:hypothetical protein [Empedobacter stercoris]MCA4775600.1 hypothetical protein [Empedobacter stercoris]
MEQNRIRLAKENRNIKNLSYVFSAVLVGLILFLFVIFYEKEENVEETITKPNLISDKVENEILIELDHFEHNKGYLNPHITIVLLAKELDTNVKYLSSILNNSKQKSFNNYINELRIEYIVKCL